MKRLKNKLIQITMSDFYTQKTRNLYDPKTITGQVVELIVEQIVERVEKLT